MIKNVMRCCLALLSSLFLLNAICFHSLAAGKQTTEYGVYQVLTSSNLRATPSKDGSWVACLPAKAYVVMLEAPDSNFCHISYDGVEGYVYRGCIKKVEDESIIEEVLGVKTELKSAPTIPEYIASYVEEQRNLAIVRDELLASLSENNAEKSATGDDEKEDSGTEESNDTSSANSDSGNTSTHPTISNVSLVGVRVSTGDTSNTEDDLDNTQTTKGTILANAVMRQAPSTSATKLGVIAKGESVDVIDDGENGYLHVTYDDKEGYVYSTVVSYSEGSSRNTSGVVDTIVAEQTTGNVSALGARRVLSGTEIAIVSNLNISTTDSDVTVETEELASASQVAGTTETIENDINYQIRMRANMRVSPSKSGQWITTIPTGASVDVLGENEDGYTLVQYNGIKGYVLESLVVDAADVVNSISGQTDGAVLFTLTGYCTCQICTGSHSPEVTGQPAHTATGTEPVQGRTIAVDPSVIPYGTVVHIDGMGDYVAEDCGGKINGNHIDVYFDSHEDAVAFGRQNRYVTID